MKRKAYFGMLSWVLLGTLCILSALEPAGIFPFTKTFFFPMFALLGFLVGLVGWLEKDKVKWPGMLGAICGALALIGWIVLLIWRLVG